MKLAAPDENMIKNTPTLLDQLNAGKSATLIFPYPHRLIELLPVLMATGVMLLVLTEFGLLLVALYSAIEIDRLFFWFIDPFACLVIILLISWVIRKNYQNPPALNQLGIMYKNVLYPWGYIKSASFNNIDPDYGAYQFNLLINSKVVSFRTTPSQRDELGKVLEKYAQLKPVAIADYRFPVYRWTKEGKTFHPITWRDKTTDFLSQTIRK